ncbi:MAG: hypothetical protein RQ736_13005 [Thiogranum sp.]|nr:hypothetical protein [Thiogranum sp.]
MSGYARNLIADLGALRVVLVLLGLLSAIFTPLADGVDYQGWGLVAIVLGPVFAPMIFAVLIMDAVMTGATSAEAGEEARGAGRIVVRINLLVMAIIAISWVPFILSISG